MKQSSPQQAEGWILFREYLDELARVTQATPPQGVVAVFKEALVNLARLISGIEQAMTTVSRV